jgi:predicted DNA-binding transcriptional regulator
LSLKQSFAEISLQSREKIEYELRGKTLKVYLYLLKHNGASGISEIQKMLGFSSPSIAVHHVEKLIRLGIVERTESGEYILSRKVDVGVLSAFIQIGRFMAPRSGFYAGFFTGLTLIYIIGTGAAVDPFGTMIGVTASIVFWYESLKAWRSRPTT